MENTKAIKRIGKYKKAVNKVKGIITEPTLIEAIDTILLDYEKLQEENEELNTRLQEAINEKCELKTELYLNSMPKSKIKDKIETYRRVISDSNDEDLIHDLRTKIHILEELLENNKK